MKIHLTDLCTIENPKLFKVHLASWNRKRHPLDVFVADTEEWEGWNRWRSTKDDFNRQYIFALIDFYHEKDIWLFGGIYEVVERYQVSRSLGYEVKLTNQFKSLIGRLKIHWKRSGRTKARRLESCLENFEVSELLKSEYTGESFPGYEKVLYDFSTLESIFKTNRSDWKAALEHAKGVYMILDKNNGKKYIGSAYGEAGLWSRWACYIGTGHGHNDELTALVRKRGDGYARENFRFSILEHFPRKVEDNLVLARESHWKNAMMSREFSYNKN